MVEDNVDDHQRKCKILNIDEEKQTVIVHYYGWNLSFDESEFIQEFHI